MSLGFGVEGIGGWGTEKSEKEFQDPQDRKARGQRLLVSKHWPVAPWNCAAMIQEKADKDISNVGLVFFFFNPESRENARSGIKAPKRARRRRNNQN